MIEKGDPVYFQKCLETRQYTYRNAHGFSQDFAERKRKIEIIVEQKMVDAETSEVWDL